MSYKSKTLFEMTDEEVEEYFNSPEGIIMLENMFKTIEKNKEDKKKSEE